MAFLNFFEMCEDLDDDADDNVKVERQAKDPTEESDDLDRADNADQSASDRAAYEVDEESDDELFKGADVLKGNWEELFQIHRRSPFRVLTGVPLSVV